MAFALISGARHSLCPPLRAGPLTTPQASRYATDRIVAPPYRAFDAGLRPGPFPDRAASLLPGLLAATRTGLPPAGDDELTNTKNTMALRHGVTSCSAGRTKYWGYCCAACGFSFEERYGSLGHEYIHVHHVVELSTVGPGYKVNPKKDLRPICPNCHAMIHRPGPGQALTIDELKEQLRPTKQIDPS
jgi:hypothetical protein